jgi:oxygen-dependent protoporphyrinogen oxidase
MRRRVTIIGGGISGLAAAHHLHEVAPDAEITLLESGSRVGGVIQTTKHDGYLIESAADNFITTSPSAIDLCQRVGLGDDLICTQPTGRRAMVLRDGKLQPIPAGFLVMAPSRLWPLLSTRVLSVPGKLRSACEMLIPKKQSNEDESLKSFVCRRFGREMFDRLVQPLVGGIYTADPDRLSVAATMPRFLEMERKHGSLMRAMLKQRWSKQQRPENSGGARYSQFMTLRGGMSSLTERLAQTLPSGSIQLDSPVLSVVPKDNGWSIRRTGKEPSWVNADAVIVAAPAKPASQMLATVDHRIAEELGQIEYASCAVVSLAFRREQIGTPLDSFGFVVPLVEERFILSCSFSSLKYEGRAPKDTVLMRVFIGGACQRGLLRMSSQELTELAHWELARVLDIEGEPLLRSFTRQDGSMPQYHVGHGGRVAAIEQRLKAFPTLALSGNSLSGVGVPGCIESGRKAAERVAKALKESVRPLHQPYAVN